VESNFWYFHQNNSGGSFIINEHVAELVIIEANSELDAIDKGMDVGIYFDGCAKGIDCECCGDRWSISHRLAESIMEFINVFYTSTFHQNYTIIIHFVDGIGKVTYDNGIKMNIPDHIKLRIL
jgi:hypothetical protein